MYTDSCRASQEGSLLVKFSDDTALHSLLSGPQSDHGKAITSCTKWCDDNFSDLNVIKTKELIDFCKNSDDPIQPAWSMERKSKLWTLIYLGTVFDNQLKFHSNIDSIVKRGQQRIHLLRKLNSFCVSKVILKKFYYSLIESLPFHLHAGSMGCHWKIKTV